MTENLQFGANAQPHPATHSTAMDAGTASPGSCRTHKRCVHRAAVRSCIDSYTAAVVVGRDERRAGAP